MVFLHACCAPCATWCTKRLQDEGKGIVFFYDNPNIYPESEREKRLENLKILATYNNIELIIAHTPHEKWLEFVEGYENEPEKGKR